MTNPRRASLDEQLPGLQRAFFEIIWRIFPWIRSIWIKEGEGQFDLFVETAAPQDEKEWDNFDYHADEAFNASESHKIRHTTLRGSRLPHKGGYRELMSDRIFKKIARKHAPWRLEEGQ